MAPRTSSTNDVPAGDENAAAAVPVPVADVVPAPSPEAENTPGQKWIRTTFRGDQFRIDKNTLVTGEPKKYPATRAKEIIELARVNGVRLAVSDVEKG